MVLTVSSTEKSKYTITGPVSILLSNRRAKLLLKTKLDFEEVNGIILINSNETIDRVAYLLSLASKYIGAKVQYDDNVSADISKFKESEERFAEFSIKAKDIKENRCVISDFHNFSDILCLYMKNRTLYQLQLLSAYHLAFSQNSCNFSVPGAGKTSIVYGAYTYLKNIQTDSPKKVDKLIIISPLSAFGPWELEYKECFGSEIDCKRINGSISTEEKKQYFYGRTAEVTLISFASVVSIKDSLKYFLSNHKTMVVIDEAHKIKNTNGGITASTILDLAPICTSRVILTGTPAPNGYEDLYNLFQFIWPKRLITNYTVGQLRDMTRSREDKRIPKLLDNINPYYIRIKKEDLGIPEPIENLPVKVRMKESQRRIYDFIEQQFISEVSTLNSELHSTLVKAKLIRLRQVATNPALLRIPISEFIEDSDLNFSSIIAEDSLIMNDIIRYYKDEIPSKFEACAKLINSILLKKEKVVVWATFVKNINYLQDYLNSIGIKCKTLYGATPVATDGMTLDDENYELTREAIIKEFHKSDCDYNVIIANPFAVAESISLHKACHNAIYLERSFNLTHFIQSKDRIHRYGLPKDVDTNYYYILSEDSVDESIHNRLIQKEERMLSVIETSPIPLFDNIGDDGDEDIKAIINEYVRRKNRKV